MNNLALADYVDLDDKEARRSYILKTLIAGIILIAAYLGGPVVINFLFKTFPRIPNLIRIGILLLFIAIMAYLLIRVADTTKLFNQKIKQGKTKILTIIFLTLLILFLSLRLTNLIEVFKLPAAKIVNATMTALNAGIIEELLFRGLFFNLFLVVFEKSKYLLIWASLFSSIAFGLIHLINLVHQPLKSTIGQIIFAITIGLILCYCRIITNNVILGIIIHTYVDFMPQIITSDTGSGDHSLLSLFIPYAIVIVFVLICIYAFNRSYNKMIFSLQ